MSREQRVLQIGATKAAVLTTMLAKRSQAMREAQIADEAMQACVSLVLADAGFGGDVQLEGVDMIAQTAIVSVPTATERKLELVKDAG